MIQRFLSKPQLGDEDQTSEDGEVAVQEKISDLAEPPRYAVVLHNDDYTTMEFVIEVLTRFFRKTHDQAIQLTLQIHHRGRAIAGVFSFDIAETKVMQVTQLARSKGHPLKCTMEPSEGNN